MADQRQEDVDSTAATDEVNRFAGNYFDEVVLNTSVLRYTACDGTGVIN
jgi:hypothetical protein